MEDRGGDHVPLWFRAFHTAKKAADDKTTFRPLPALLIALVAWGIIVWALGMDNALPLLAVVVVLIHPVLWLIWGITFLAVFVAALALLPVVDAIEAFLVRRRKRRHARRGHRG